MRRNAFGRQNESAEVPLAIPALGSSAVSRRFSFARRGSSAAAATVELLAERDGHGVMVREGNVLATAFHPELTDDPRVHRYFVGMTGQQGKPSAAA